MGCNLPGSSDPGIFQARILKWVAVSFSRGSSQPRDQTWASHIAGRRFYHLSHQGSHVSEAPPQGPERGPQPGCGASPIKPQQGDVLGVEGREENECSQSHLVASRTYHLTLSSHLPAAGRGPRVVQWLSGVRLFAIPWTAAHQASLSSTTSQSLFKLMSFRGDAI